MPQCAPPNCQLKYIAIHTGFIRCKLHRQKLKADLTPFYPLRGELLMLRLFNRVPQIA